MQIFSDTPCELGEGPLWHPELNALFWFDILEKRMYSKAPGDAQKSVQFDDYVSAAGWVDAQTLLVASAKGLWRFDIDTEAQELVASLEADNLVTRSNDGRADPQGGFWIGTMGIGLERDAGAIYRYYRGEMRQLYAPITIPNSICFAPDGRRAYFTDTGQQRIQTVALDANGWPMGAPELFVDLRAQGLNPDGSVVDADGNLWNAQWGAGRVACYDPDGVFLRSVDIPAAQATCPAFGDGTLYVTSAAEGLEADGAGMTYALDLGIAGQREHQVIL